MNEIISKLLWTGKKFIPEMHLIQPGFTCSACDSFYTNKERTKKFKNAGDCRYTYQNELDKTCFQRHIVYVDFKDLPKKKLLIRYYATNGLISLKIQNMMHINEVLLQWFRNFLINNLLRSHG